ncbi:hypothetical protein [Mycobacterium sp. URHB0021]
MAATFGGAAGTIAFLLAQGAGVGRVVASFAAAVPIGLVRRLMERRNLAPPTGRIAWHRATATRPRRDRRSSPPTGTGD